MRLQRLNFNGERDEMGLLCSAVDTMKIEDANTELFNALSNLMSLIMHPSIEADETIKEIVAAENALDKSKELRE